MATHNRHRYNAVRRDSYGLEVPACECGAFKPEGMFDALIRIQAAAKAGDIDIADVNKRLVGELREVLST